MGARRIAGITVEIGGDTTKLTTALKDVDKALSTTQSSLRDVNKLLKLDPGNTELLAQKHRLLGEAVSEAKEKLATLKTAAEQANQALANGEITQSQYDALQREIIETEQKLKDLERQAENSSVALQKIGQVGDKLQAVGDKVSGVGENKYARYGQRFLERIKSLTGGTKEKTYFGELDEAAVGEPVRGGSGAWGRSGRGRKHYR